ncbi:MAG: NAD(P)(+) transhydrogenase (Re/Si-specific) subunit beta [Gammaproteobacteria bacterium]|nr:NAD(P)(+) transhydrogenase (Re/Si-specific) subunit beta [Gammaproteobacteria bacterium]MCP5425819.1 NAD(P)(+) transhydrogenase (Re/Si-specific) subunit beta [Gammaproteobacteria bacterium]MCP5458570.1 NAD(P)(+) transhydrogenase (Re/Si-specific) subunit beta [Gammaproteobacteria bacterium]
MGVVIELSYFLTAILFILGLKRMSHPTTARSGIWWAGGGMVLATVVSFMHPEIAGNQLLMVVAILIGGGIAWYTGKRVAMTDMPQMIAIYNGMGGGAAGAIAAVELVKLSSAAAVVAEAAEPAVHHSTFVVFLAVLGAMIGTVSFSGSCVAYAKLQGLMKKVIRFPNQQKVNMAVFALMVLFGLLIIFSSHPQIGVILLFFLLALAFGAMMAVPIGGADMPVVISLFNAFTGLAVAFEGFVLQNSALIIAGTVVGAAGTLLTQLMAKAMNRPISNVLFSGFGDTGGGPAEEVTGSMKAMEPMDAAVMMSYASKVVIVPGYGLAVAQAQHKIWEMTELLEERGVEVKFAIHPVAGRMPGHMNVLLAEAGVPYDKIYDLEEINSDFANTDVALVIGANDVVNPSAKSDKSSPIYGMPILDVDEAKNVLVIKRGQGTGFSGIENKLFFLENTSMVYGDGQKVAAELIQHIKTL